MLFTIEVGLIDGEAVDEQLALAGITAQQVNIVSCRQRIALCDEVGHTTLDVVTLGFPENHATLLVDYGADLLEIRRGERWGTIVVEPGRRVHHWQTRS